MIDEKEYRENEKKQNRVRLTGKFLKEKKLDCLNCANISILENNVQFCEGTSIRGISARGARADENYCGMAGKFFKPLSEEEREEKNRLWKKKYQAELYKKTRAEKDKKAKIKKEDEEQKEEIQKEIKKIENKALLSEPNLNDLDSLLADI